jgi:hypothetical protein
MRSRAWAPPLSLPPPQAPPTPGARGGEELRANGAGRDEAANGVGVGREARATELMGVRWGGAYGPPANEAIELGRAAALGQQVAAATESENPSPEAGERPGELCRASEPSELGANH